MLMSSGPLVADCVRTLIEHRSDKHDQRVWMDAKYEDGRVHLTGCVGAWGAVLAGTVQWMDWEDRTQEGGLTCVADGSQVYADDDRWFEWGRAALDITPLLAHSLFAKWVGHRAAIEALTDLVDAVDDREIVRRLDRTIIVVPGTRLFLRDPRGYRRD
jgi:hypothetical protein